MKLVSEMDFLTEDQLFEQDFENRVKICEAVVAELSYYDREILELYMEHGSLRKVTKTTMIPKSSIHETIKRIREKVKERLCA